MPVMRFNCVIDGKKTTTTISEDLIRFYLVAKHTFEGHVGSDCLINKSSNGYMLGLGKAEKAEVQKDITSWRSLKSVDEIEFKMLNRVLYTKMK